MSDLKSLAELWHRRAGVADTAATELDDLSRQLRWALRANNLGQGCAEGEWLFSKLSGVVMAASADLNGMVSAARSVSDACNAAALAYENGDEVAAEGVRG